MLMRDAYMSTACTMQGLHLGQLYPPSPPPPPPRFQIFFKIGFLCLASTTLYLTCIQILAFDTPFPLRILNKTPSTGHGYFLELPITLFHILHQGHHCSRTCNGTDIFKHHLYHTPLARDVTCKFHYKAGVLSPSN